ncbi:DUF1707 SHOCT-like domain-containing protein [Actinomadura parmotrematis]|uniref:DUF1707 domain-containing protein n=1 Tax=Actinomadura parmotrematis TaxID=2864039 RepID=A0ABS7G508_9ACTN|nr:DUF1707 domain-containing protein [Actinomadura parmotrematis]MBW8487465.1 DUF1707 domain-containing protein [Actinomadura parmotrematis]
MASNPEIRASDADRDRVAGALREHCALGRITTDELQERIEAVYAARTLGQLEEVTSDLPEEDLHARPVPASQRAPQGGAAKAHGGHLQHGRAWAAWGSWASVSLVCTVIWLISAITTGTVDNFWPIWVMGPWGALILAGYLFGDRGRGRRD